MKQEEKALIEDVVFHVLNVLRERSYAKYVLGQELYRKKVEIACEWNDRYEQMELADEQREIIEHMLQTRSDAADCELTLTYMAGMLDGVMFLRRAGLLDLYMEEGEQD